MFGWIKRALAYMTDGEPHHEALPARKVYLGSREHIAQMNRTTAWVQEAPIQQRFGADLREITAGVRSMDQWLARVAVLEWEYDLRVPPGLWITAHNDAITEINLYRASLRNTVKRHQRRAARIYRTSRAASLA